MLRFSVGIPCGVRVRARGVGDCRGKCRRYIVRLLPPSEGDSPKSKSGGVVTSVGVGGATAYVASGEIEVPLSALLVT